jgi:hypothetical protein
VKLSPSKEEFLKEGAFKVQYSKAFPPSHSNGTGGSQVFSVTPFVFDTDNDYTFQWLRANCSK